MVAFIMRKQILAVMLALVLSGALPESAFSQDCGCAADLCCSQMVIVAVATTTAGQDAVKALVMHHPARMVLELPILSRTRSSTELLAKPLQVVLGKASTLEQPVGSYSQFGTTGSTDDSKREIAAFFAHATHETGHFCHKEEIDGPSKDYCDENNTQYPCVQGKGYYGRGPLQLSWNYNYGPAGQSIGFDGLNNPDIVASDVLVSFKASLWFWMNNVHSVIGQGFGATIRAINGQLEYNGADPGTVTTRVGYYTDYCDQLGVAPGDNLRC
ncbi:hypothetical protein RJ639_037956 [Escallonia herrerae]|uniref:Glycoside hydrolase family 19 catalytic domain-containing protein n=1 Tax=Escallonia herrerae TaxID=1293975 RepID=A0AA89B4Z9_9ASTE|nr:hypothetical protein RJ639_037956 [Escallonia herrerae]